MARRVLAAGAERLQGRSEWAEANELGRQISYLERALGRKAMEAPIRSWLDLFDRSRVPVSWNKSDPVAPVVWADRVVEPWLVDLSVVHDDDL